MRKPPLPLMMPPPMLFALTFAAGTLIQWLADAPPRWTSGETAGFVVLGVAFLFALVLVVTLLSRRTDSEPLRQAIGVRGIWRIPVQSQSDVCRADPYLPRRGSCVWIALAAPADRVPGHGARQGRCSVRGARTHRDVRRNLHDILRLGPPLAQRLSGVPLSRPHILRPRSDDPSCLALLHCVGQPASHARKREQNIGASSARFRSRVSAASAASQFGASPVACSIAFSARASAPFGFIAEQVARAHVAIGIERRRKPAKRFAPRQHLARLAPSRPAPQHTSTCASERAAASPCSGPDNVASPASAHPASEAPVDAAIRTAKSRGSTRGRSARPERAVSRSAPRASSPHAFATRRCNGPARFSPVSASANPTTGPMLGSRRRRRPPKARRILARPRCEIGERPRLGVRAFATRPRARQAFPPPRPTAGSAMSSSVAFAESCSIDRPRTIELAIAHRRDRALQHRLAPGDGAGRHFRPLARPAPPPRKSAMS